MDDPPRTPAWNGWRGPIALALTVLAARIAYLIWLCPYELIEDEAHYWEWSRRLDLSYYTKGPGVAWAIAATTRLFGDHEWSVRLPAALAGFVAMLAVAGLAMRVSRDRRAGLWACALWACAPMHLASGLLMTIDGPYLACWALAAWAGWLAISRRSGPALIAFALAMGVGFLFKYTILLPGLGVALAALLHKPDEQRARMSPLWPALALAAFLAAVSPVIIWNTQRGWPTIRHLLEHFHAAGTQTTAKAAHWSYNPMWTLGFLGAQLAMGPALGLMLLAIRRALRNRANPDEPITRPAARYLLIAAAPVLLFYLIISLTTDAEGNWPVAGYTTLIILAAAYAPSEMDRYKSLIRDWTNSAPNPRDRPRRGILRRKPETAWQILTHWTIGAGLAVGLGTLRIDLFTSLPLVGPLVPLYRLAGAAQRATKAAALLDSACGASASPKPIVIAQHYGPASQTAFYWPRPHGAPAPTIYCARGEMGGQPSQYDFFPDTNLHDPALAGACAILIGSDEHLWSPAFDALEPAGSLDDRDAQREARGKAAKYGVYIGRGYHGWPAPKEPPASNAPRANQR